MLIQEAKARVVLNSKAAPTIETVLRVEGAEIRASAPSGTSAGKHEVKAWPDAPNIDLSVRLAKEKLETEVFPEIVGRDVEPEEIDEMLETVDGTEDFSKIGGNAALSLSIAAVKAFAWEQGIHVFEAVSELYGFHPSFPYPLENFIGGGAHGGSSDIQEFLVSARGEESAEIVHFLSFLYRETKKTLEERDPNFVGALTLESAYITSLNTEEILEILKEIGETIQDAGYEPVLGVDVAASEMWDGEKYVWKKQMIERSREEQMEYVKGLIDKYGLFYVEDPFHEDDFDAFRELQKRTKAKIVGDDLFVTNAQRIVGGIGGIIIKPNQRGTLSRTVEAIRRARANDMLVVVSHRSGETDDPFITQFAVGVGADFAKIGAAGIRTVKLNELIRISELL